VNAIHVAKATERKRVNYMLTMRASTVSVSITSLNPSSVDILVVCFLILRARYQERRMRQRRNDGTKERRNDGMTELRYDGTMEGRNDGATE
jgi:hypothetical protein